MNPEKLLWINQQHLVRAEPKDVVPHLRWHLRAARHRFAGRCIARRHHRGAARARQDAEGNGGRTAASSSATTVTLDPKAAEKHLTADARGLLGEIARALRRAARMGRARDARDARSASRQRKALGLGKVAQPHARRGLGRHGVAAHRCDAGAAGPGAHAGAPGRGVTA